MQDVKLQTVVRRIRTVAAASPAVELTDRQLLQAFSARGEQQAFAALVDRHGPLVLGVCRRVLRQEQDAEDAFQATFLVLARNVGAIRKREALGSWLYGVAYRVTMRARQQTEPGRAKGDQHSATAPSDPGWKAAWQEVQAILDEEVQALPEKQRTVFVFCCLEGLP